MKEYDIHSLSRAAEQQQFYTAYAVESCTGITFFCRIGFEIIRAVTLPVWPAMADEVL